MSAQDTGGWAFPCHGSMGEVAWEGMSLRDYFAAKAMTALVPLCSDDARDEGLSYPEHIAAVSYGMADAMLKARQA